MSTINAVIVAAMDEEMAPFKTLMEDFSFSKHPTPFGSAQLARKGRSSLLFATTGIGMVAASALLSWLLGKYQPRIVISVGSAGGLDDSLAIGDVVIGTEYVHGRADATAFGYRRGQIPGQPERFKLAESLREPVAEVQATSRRTVHTGAMVSSDSFVTAQNVAELRTEFPGVLSADMESQALAHVSHAFKVPFASIRSISDVVGAESATDQAKTFHGELSDAATGAALTTLELLLRADALDVDRSEHGPPQHFSKASLQGALYLILARAHDMAPSDADIPADVREDVDECLSALDPQVRERTLGLIAAGYELARSTPNAALTAKNYDIHRADFLEHYPASERTGFPWPPTSQTVIKRFNGYWNDALGAIGLAPRRGRNRGGLKFTADDYLFAIRSYIVDAKHSKRQPSFNNYSQWLKDSGNSGKLPSGAAIRQRFGSWKEALNAAA